MTGATFSSNPSIYSLVGGILISNTTSGEELLRITANGEIFYRFENNMTKVNCPEDVSEAFLWTVFGFTGKETEDVIIDKYIEKISNNERSNEYLSKIERIIRKNKLKKLKF